MSPDRNVNPGGAVLADTSAWIESFRSSGSPKIQEYMRTIVKSGLAATCPVVRLELAYGCRTREEYSRLMDYLDAQQNLDFDSESWRTSREIAFSARKKGITVPTVDILIAALAVRRQILLAHHDSHFEAVAKILPGLKTICFL